MKNDFLIRKLYISFLMVSILSVLAATLGILIDNIIVGLNLGDHALGVMGIVGPISLVFSAFGNICASGGTTRLAQAIGKMDKEAISSIFTVTMLFAFTGGVIFTVLGLLFTPQIAMLLGAKDVLLAQTIDYLRGYFLGSIPIILFSTLSGFVKLDGATRLPLISIVVMSVLNVLLDLLMIHVFSLGMFGIALATTISYYVAVLMVCTHFLRKSASLHLRKPQNGRHEWIQIVVTGSPTALSRICDTIKVVVLNHLLLYAVGVGAVAALNVRTQANHLFGAFVMGVASAAAPILGMFYGEKDRQALKDTLKNTFQIGLFLNGAIAVFLFLAASTFVSMLGVKEADTKEMAVMAVRMLAIGMPFALLNHISMVFFQSTKRVAMASYICLMQSLGYVLLLAFVLIRPLAELGVWLSFVFTEVLTLLTTVIVIACRNRSIPRKLSDFMMLQELYGNHKKNRWDLSIGNDMNALMDISRVVYQVGRERSLDDKMIQNVSQCIEEIGSNIIRHAFAKGEKRWFDIMIVDNEDEMVVRFRDNGRMFNPLEYLSYRKADEERFGLLIGQGIADDFTYKRVLELNTVILTFKKRI